MNRLNKLFALAGIVAACFIANDSMAQNGGGGGGGGGFGGGGGGFGGGGGGGGGRRGRGNFDPAQMRQDYLDNAKTALEVTDDSEWNVLSVAVGKVFDAQQALNSATPRGGFGRRNRNGGGGAGGGNGGGAAGGAQAGGGGGGGGQQGGGRFGTQSPEVQALRDAIDNNAPADEIKQKLAKVRDVQKADQDKLDAARSDLVKLLTPRQEASAVLMGLLK